MIFLCSKEENSTDIAELEDLEEIEDDNLELPIVGSSDPTIDSEEDIYNKVQISDDKEEVPDNSSHTELDNETTTNFNMNFSSFSDTLAEAFEDTDKDEILEQELSTPIDTVDEDELTDFDNNRELDAKKNVEADTEDEANLEEDDADLQNTLENRLGIELEKASAFEQDLTLIIVRIKDLNKDTTANQRIETLLFDVFKYEDLVFQYKDDGYAGIMLDTNLDAAMKISENMYREIGSVLSSFDYENKVGIGLSTRNIRIIPAQRLLNEADKAVEHSFEEEEMPIVAFKVNPEKYRQFLSQQM